MIETIIREYLEEKTSVPVRMERRPNLPDACIIVEKTGSAYKEGIWNATIAIQSYGATLKDAALLNSHVIDWMLQIRDTDDRICDVTLNGDYNYTDTSSKRYRYQAVFYISYYN